jgi:hypothetical protein
MSPHKAGKKQESSAEDSNPNMDILSDTTARITDAIKSWKQVYDILEHEILLCPDDLLKKMTKHSWLSSDWWLSQNCTESLPDQRLCLTTT